MGDRADATGTSKQVSFEGATPILRVSDFDLSVAYYVDVLGFTLSWQVGHFGSVHRGDAHIMLSEASQGCSSTWIFIGVSDADALHDEIVGHGARIRHPPTNYPWGSREVHVFDPDGHVLRMGSDAPRGAPLGPWLDEEGVLWLPRDDGSWVRSD